MEKVTIEINNNIEENEIRIRDYIEDCIKDYNKIAIVFLLLFIFFVMLFGSYLI